MPFFGDQNNKLRWDSNGFPCNNFIKALFHPRVKKSTRGAYRESLAARTTGGLDFSLKDIETDDRPCIDKFFEKHMRVRGLQGVNKSLGKRILDRTGAIPYRAFSVNCLRDRKIFDPLNSNRKGECCRRKQCSAGASGRLLPVGKRHENCV